MTAVLLKYFACERIPRDNLYPQCYWISEWYRLLVISVGMVSIPEVNLPLILRMRSGNNEVDSQFQDKTPYVKMEISSFVNQAGNPIILRGWSNVAAQGQWNPVWPPAAILINQYDVITPPCVELFQGRIQGGSLGLNDPHPRDRDALTKIT